MDEKFIGFYTSRPFWAGEPIDFNTLIDPRDYNTRMSEIVFRYTTDSYKLFVCKDGMLMLQILELETSKLKESSDVDDILIYQRSYLDYGNCLHLILDSTMLELLNIGYCDLYEITSKDVFHIRFKGEDTSDAKYGGYSIPTESVAFAFHNARYIDSLSNPILQGQFFSRWIFPKNVFDRVSQLFELIIDDKLLVKLLSDIALSISEYKVGNLSMSIVMAWFVIERILGKKWQELLDNKNENYEGGKVRFNSKRKDILVGSDYPISAISNILEIMEILPFEVFERIDKVRSYRNSIVHQKSKYICKSEHSMEAINLALDLTLEEQSFTLTPNLSRTIRF